uniref:ANK_REP_REGION domain-containing protein n=1 Tax=Macrostomum lignano TaxID=282301 RepID=A0A1I8IR73_9PLAT
MLRFRSPGCLAKELSPFHSMQIYPINFRHNHSSEPGSPDSDNAAAVGPPVGQLVRRRNSFLSAMNKNLIEACKRGSLDKMRSLRDEGADLCAADGAGMTCLHHATRFGYKDIVAYLIENGPPQLLDMIDTEKGQTALHKASWYQRRQICHLLVQAGASLTITDFSGLTPRQQAQRAEDSELALWLESESKMTPIMSKSEGSYLFNSKCNNVILSMACYPNPILIIYGLLPHSPFLLSMACYPTPHSY